MGVLDEILNNWLRPARRDQMNCTTTTTTYFGKVGPQVYRCEISLDMGKVEDYRVVDRYPYEGEPEVFPSIEAFCAYCEGSEADW
jgi:hypothetical protein